MTVDDWLKDVAQRYSPAAAKVLRDEIKRLTAEVTRLEGICDRAAGAIITGHHKQALAIVMAGVPNPEDAPASTRRSPTETGD